MNLTTNRFTFSTMLVAACATVALVGAESVQAQTQTPVPLQRIEVVGQRFVPTQQIVIVGQRHTEPTLQRIVIVGQRQRGERVAAANLRARTL